MSDLSRLPSFDCVLCRSKVPADNIEDHLRLFHPDYARTFERWPDGSVVIIDDTLGEDPDV